MAGSWQHQPGPWSVCHVSLTCLSVCVNAKLEAATGAARAASSTFVDLGSQQPRADRSALPRLLLSRLSCVRTDGQDGWAEGRADGRAGGRTDRRKQETDGRAEGQTRDGRTDGRSQGRTGRRTNRRQTGGLKDKQATDGRKDRQAGGQTGDGRAGGRTDGRDGLQDGRTDGFLRRDE